MGGCNSCQSRQLLLKITVEVALRQFHPSWSCRGLVWSGVTWTEGWGALGEERGCGRLSYKRDVEIALWRGIAPDAFKDSRQLEMVGGLRF